MDQITTAKPGEEERTTELNVMTPNSNRENIEKSKSEKAQENNNAATTHNLDESEDIVYPHGIQFALMSVSLCLCVFLVGLVSCVVGLKARTT